MLNFFDENPAYENHVLFTDGSGQSVTYQAGMRIVKI